MVKKILVICCVIWLSLSFSGCSFESSYNDDKTQDTIANEASIYCKNNGGTLELVPDEGGTRGKCNFDDGSFCEEWAYYHGECSPGRGNGNTLNIDKIQNNSGINEEFLDLVGELGEENLVNTENDTENNLDSNEVTTNNCQQSEVKKCDDGTFLVREGPDCEFGSCPGYPLSDEFVQNILNQYENSGSDLQESDIDLMNEIISVMTQI